MARDKIMVWDPFVRIGHWVIVAGFFIAYFTEDDLLTLHVWAGYVVGLVVLFRIIWGFVGPQHARFSDFVRGPAAALTYLFDLVRFRAARYLGHSPAGGIMAIALLASLAATVISGLMVYGADKKAGPLAPLYASGPAGATTVGQMKGEAKAEERQEPGNSADTEGDEGESATKEVHEVLANLTLILVLAHIAGVVLASVAHRENLVLAMITGRKDAQDTRAGARSRPDGG